MKGDPEQLARLFKILSVEVRIRIVQLLQGRSLCVNALAARLSVTQGAVSQHLRIMRDAGLVVGEKRGYYVHYRLNEAAIAAYRQEIDSLLAGAGQPSEKKRKGERPCAAKGKRKGARSRKT